ncbi:hypothetical protein [Pendulispora albinea]|uniref:Uncharacterized protein n=1 Tax=Pendulispora albinea TaxID=2741071 RepID=A0ABZ2MCY2_9BACT
MTKRSFGPAFLVLTLFAGAAPASILACNAILGIEDVSPAPREAGPGTDAPAESGVDPTCLASPQQDATVIREACGIFAVPTGSDAHPGTRAQPVKTLRRAIELAAAGKTARVYLCATTYPEPMTIGREGAFSGLSIYGGLECDPSWRYTGARTIVQPAAPPPPAAPPLPLRIHDAPGRVVLDGLAFVATSATEPGQSSVAGYVSASSSVAIRGSEFTAGNGQPGADANDPVPPTQDQSTPDGNQGRSDSSGGGSAKACRCQPTGIVTTGGRGGDSDKGGGNNGLPALSAGMGGKPISFPSHAESRCTLDGAQDGGAGQAGANGATGQSAGDAGYGSIRPEGWLPASGISGEHGGTGQGGGGGRGGLCAGAGFGALDEHNEGGGGGGCGGCGGTGGNGGGGGGSSIALLIKDAAVSIVESTLTAKDGAKGGRGTAGTEPSPPGAAGAPASAGCACSGGAGGRGGRGGHGGGGAGGLSAGVVYSGLPPQIDDLTSKRIGVGRAGSGGAGASSSSGAAASGLNGLAQPIVRL